MNNAVRHRMRGPFEQQISNFRLQPETERHNIMADSLVKLLFSNQNCQAQCVQLDESWQQMKASLEAPAPAIRMLGELAAAAALMASGLKFEGALVLQIVGDGPVKLALVEVRTGMKMRATIQMRPGVPVPENATFKDMVNANGQGRCAAILDLADRRPNEDPYQGVVPLTGNTVAETLEGFMTLSEQIPTRLWLAADDKSAGGLIMQRLPSHGGNVEEGTTEDTVEEGFREVHTFAQTVKREELLGVAPMELCRRLFWELNPSVLETVTPSFACRCSRDNITKMIRSFGEKEAREIIAEQGTLKVRCEFCGSLYLFDADDIDEIFGGKPAKQPADISATSKGQA